MPKVDDVNTPSRRSFLGHLAAASAVVAVAGAAAGAEPAGAAAAIPANDDTRDEALIALAREFLALQEEITAADFNCLPEGYTCFDDYVEDRCGDGDDLLLLLDDHRASTLAGLKARVAVLMIDEEYQYIATGGPSDYRDRSWPHMMIAPLLKDILALGANGGAL